MYSNFSKNPTTFHSLLTLIKFTLFVYFCFDEINIMLYYTAFAVNDCSDIDITNET